VSIIGELLPKATMGSSSAASSSSSQGQSQGQGPAKKKIIIRPNRQ
jgi:hypothetical protein